MLCIGLAAYIDPGYLILAVDQHINISHASMIIALKGSAYCLKSHEDITCFTFIQIIVISRDTLLMKKCFL